MSWSAQYAPGVRALITALLRGLPSKSLDKVKWVVHLLEEFDLRLTDTKHAERVDDKLCALRIPLHGVQIRIYYFRSGPQEFTLVHAFKKKTRELPPAETQKAQEVMMSQRERHDR